MSVGISAGKACPAEARSAKAGVGIRQNDDVDANRGGVTMLSDAGAGLGRNEGGAPDLRLHMRAGAVRQAILVQHLFAPHDADLVARFVLALDHQADRAVAERPEPFNVQ